MGGALKTLISARMRAFIHLPLLISGTSTAAYSARERLRVSALPSGSLLVSWRWEQEQSPVGGGGGLFSSAASAALAELGGFVLTASAGHWDPQDAVAGPGSPGVPAAAASPPGLRMSLDFELDDDDAKERAATAAAAISDDELLRAMAALHYAPSTVVVGDRFLRAAPSLARTLARAAASLPRLSARLAADFLGAAGTSALRIALTGLADDFLTSCDAASLAGVVALPPLPRGSRLPRGAAMAAAAAAVAAKTINDDAGSDNAGSGARMHALAAALRSPVDARLLHSRLLAASAPSADRAASQAAATRAAAAPYHRLPRSCLSASTYGSTARLLLRATPRGGGGGGGGVAAWRAAALRLALHVPPSSHVEAPLLSPSTLSTLLGNGAAASRLYNALRGEGDLADDEVGGVVRGGSGGGGDSGGDGVAAPSGHVPCAASAELPFAAAAAAELESHSPVGCPLTSLEMLGLTRSALEGGGGGDGTGGSWCSGGTDGEDDGGENGGWDCEPVHRLGPGVGVASALVPSVLAAASRWHAITVRASRLSGVGGGGATAARLSILVEAVIEVPPRAAPAAAGAPRGLMPLAVALGLTHPRDAQRCTSAPAPNGSIALGLRSCGLQSHAAAARELQVWSCRSSGCRWRGSPLAALPRRSVRLPLSRGARRVAAAAAAPPRVWLERRLSAPLAADATGAPGSSWSGGGVGRATLLELFSIEPPGAASAGAVFNDAGGRVLVGHALPWFAAPVRSAAGGDAPAAAAVTLLHCHIAGNGSGSNSGGGGGGGGKLWWAAADGTAAPLISLDLEVGGVLQALPPPPYPCACTPLRLTVDHSFQLQRGGDAAAAAAAAARAPATLLVSRWRWRLEAVERGGSVAP